MKNRTFFFILSCIIGLLLVVIYFQLGFYSTDGFAGSIFIDRSNKKKIIDSRNSNTSIRLMPYHCIVTLYLAAPNTDDDKFFSTQVELTKIIRSFGRSPIIGKSKENTLDINPPNGHKEKLFKDWKIKIGDVQLAPLPNNGTIINSFINVLTSKNNVNITGIIDENDSPYIIMLKLLKFLGLETDYK
jgi:hypothetical protein